MITKRRDASNECWTLYIVLLACLAWTNHPCDAFFLTGTPCFPTGISTKWSRAKLTVAATSDSSIGSQLEDLKVGIAGAGPAGLFLAHKLLQHGAKVTIYESRADPRTSKDALTGFSYAFGLGARGRDAIQHGIDEELWKVVKSRGKESDRCKLHLGPLNLKLRDEVAGLDPSLLIFQSDLCAALLDELERRFPTKVDVRFQNRVVDCKLDQKRIVVAQGEDEKISEESYDLLVGCDGVNSAVRAAMKEQSSGHFTSEKKQLPGAFKVARLKTIPPKLDVDSVELMVPTKGTVTAGCIPAVNDGSCCLLFVCSKDGANTEGSIIYLTKGSEKVADMAEDLVKIYPLLEGADTTDIADQLLSQKAGRGYSVVCNVYHYDGSAAITGDAAHATGSAGQGVNSALVDSWVLSKCLLEHYDPSSKAASLEASLLAYSKLQVPEGKALYDLTAGPKAEGAKKLLYSIKSLRDTLFQGHYGIGTQPLHTLLTTSLEPFSSIRRKMDYYYPEPFPDEKALDEYISHAYD